MHENKNDCLEFFSGKQKQIDELTEYHTYVPTFALSSGLRMWIKLIMSENYLENAQKPHTEFKVEVRMNLEYIC